MSMPTIIKTHEWESTMYMQEEGIIIGQRLGVSFLRSQEEYVHLLVDNHSLKLYQSSLGIMAISGVVWDAGFLLSDYLAANRVSAIGNTLDIGCGTGVGGISALLLGATTVTFTDSFIPPSFEDNMSQLSEEQREKTAFVPFDWSTEILCRELISPINPLLSLANKNSTSLSSSANLDCPLPYDTILCSDLLYDQKAHEPLLRVLKQIMFKKAIFAYKRRHDEPERLFFHQLNKFCTISVVGQNSFELRNVSLQATSGLFIVIAIPLSYS